jgi:adenylate cyclase
MLTAHSLRNQPETGGPTPEEVRSYLHGLLERDAFSASERNRRFLSYVVRETLEGRGDRIKAYNIALAAFNRMENFDPVTDPIVRIEAGRLRRSLEHYYLTAGQVDRIRIDIPKGSYVAAFTYQHAACRAPQSAPDMGTTPVAWSHYLLRAPCNWIRLAAVMVAFGVIAGSLATYAMANYAMRPADRTMPSGQPSLAFIPFEDTGGDPTRAFVARGLTYDVGTALAQLKDVAVFGLGHAREGNGAAEHGSDFTLMGSVQTDRRNMRVAVFLVDSRTGRFLQSWSFQKDVASNDLINAQAEVAQQVLALLKEQCAHDRLSQGATAVERAFDCRHTSIVAN